MSTGRIIATICILYLSSVFLNSFVLHWLRRYKPVNKTAGLPRFGQLTSPQKMDTIQLCLTMFSNYILYRCIVTAHRNYGLAQDKPGGFG